MPALFRFPMYKVIIFFIFLTCSLPALAWQGRIVAVSAGDTMAVQPLEGGGLILVKLWGVSCPETYQPGGQLAKAFVDNLCLFKVVDIKDKVLSSANQLFAMVHLEDGSTLQQQLLQNGLAWVFDKECKGCYRWKMAEREARKDNLGIWKQEPATPLGEWTDKNG